MLNLIKRNIFSQGDVEIMPTSGISVEYLVTLKYSVCQLRGARPCYGNVDGGFLRMICSLKAHCCHVNCRERQRNTITVKVFIFQSQRNNYKALVTNPNYRKKTEIRNSISFIDAGHSEHYNVKTEEIK